MNPNLWQNHTGSEAERGTSWEYEEQRGSELSAALSVQESFPRSLPCWHKGTAGKGSGCSTCFSHRTVHHITTAARPEMSCRTHTKIPKPILEVWEWDAGPTAKLWRAPRACTSSGRAESSLGERGWSHQLGKCLG